MLCQRTFGRSARAAISARSKSISPMNDPPNAMRGIASVAPHDAEREGPAGERAELGRLVAEAVRHRDAELAEEPREDGHAEHGDHVGAASLRLEEPSLDDHQEERERRREPPEDEDLERVSPDALGSRDLLRPDGVRLDRRAEVVRGAVGDGLRATPAERARRGVGFRSLGSPWSGDSIPDRASPRHSRRGGSTRRSPRRASAPGGARARARSARRRRDRRAAGTPASGRRSPCGSATPRSGSPCSRPRSAAGARAGETAAS